MNRREDRRLANLPADAPAGTLWCGDMRREPDGRWFFGRVFVGNDHEPNAMMSGVDDSASVTAARLAAALRKACDELDRWGNVSAWADGRDALRRFERWKTGRSW